MTKTQNGKKIKKKNEEKNEKTQLKKQNEKKCSFSRIKHMTKYLKKNVFLEKNSPSQN